MSTDNLDAWLPDPTRTGKISYSQPIVDLEQALSDILIVDAGLYASPYTIPYGPADTDPKVALRFMTLRVIGSPAADWVAIHPAKKHFFTVENATTGGKKVTVKTPSGAGVVVLPGEGRDAKCDGTDIVPAGSTLQLIVLGPFPDKPSSSALMLRYDPACSYKLLAGMAGSVGSAGAPAAANADIDVQKNGVSVGTISFAAGQAEATFTMASETAFAARDILTLIAPAVQDTTLADISITLAAVRI